MGGWVGGWRACVRAHHTHSLTPPPHPPPRPPLLQVRYGAEKVFSSEAANLTDHDIDAIIAKGEQATAELNDKLKVGGLRWRGVLNGGRGGVEGGQATAELNDKLKVDGFKLHPALTHPPTHPPNQPTTHSSTGAPMQCTRCSFTAAGVL